MISLIKRPHVVHAEILLPEGAAAFMRERGALWQYVEDIEDGHSRSRDAQLAREVNLALPRELSRAANLVLARSFLLAEFVALGMVCDFAIHEQVSVTDGLVQPHIHALVTLRHARPRDLAVRFGPGAAAKCSTPGVHIGRRM